MKLISWNVNGLRAVLKKGFLDFVHTADADIICLQETKAQPQQVDIKLDKYPYHYWNSAVRKGYSGTVIFSRHEAKSVSLGLGIDKHDQEGRVILLDMDVYFLVNVYTPNARRDLARLDYRQNEWDVDFRLYVQELAKSKPVIICGDLNVAHEEIDLANPKSNRRNAGFTDEEREGIRNLLAAGFIDTFREFTPEGGHYSWWSYMAKARERNVGWRIDYFLISPTLRPQLEKAYILPDIMGSDHAPIAIELIN